MTLTEHIDVASKANLPLTINREEVIELAGLFNDAEDTSDLASEISTLASSTEHNGTGSFRLSAEQVKYVQTVIA